MEQALTLSHQAVKSVSNNLWKVAKRNDSLYFTLKEDYLLSDFLANLLARKANIDADGVNSFLNPKIKSELPDPFQLKDMREATARICKAIANKEKIVIFADYDVDGATSAATLKLFLDNFVEGVEIYVPDRLREGYGPNSEAIIALRQKGADLVITVDCGTVAFEPLESAAKVGLDVIVVDHHVGVKEKPASIAVINPNRFDETSELKYLCGAGVVFLLCVAVSTCLKNNHSFSNFNIKDILFNLLDLVAIGTVCDVVPLIGLNRSLVSTGLKIINSTNNTGVKALLSKLSISGPINAGHLGFYLGPMINAGGRIGNSHYGAILLSTSDESQARHISSTLFDLNQKRKEMEQQAVQSIVADLEGKVDEQSGGCIILASEDWHQGIIGIIASRVKDKYSRPTIICSIIDEDEKLIKASCRSVNGVHIGNLVLDAVKKGLLLKGGGHGMAAGFTAKFSLMEDIRSFINEAIDEYMTHYLENRAVEADMFLSADAINEQLCLEINQLQPFGCENRQPTFIVKDIVIMKSEILKDQHIKVFLRSKYSDKTFNAIAFRAIGSAIGDALLSTRSTVDILCTIESQWYLGKYKPSVIINDVMHNAA